MARQPMVTRTITTTEVNALCLDIVKCEPLNIDITLSRTYSDEAKLLKACKEVAETETIRVVEIVDKKEKNTIYGMTEQEFIKYASKLDENRKVVTDEADTSATPEQ